MMNRLNIVWILLIFCSCADDWNQHYKDDRGPLVVSDQTVYEYLQGKPEYSTFAGTLKKSKADSMLLNGQRYTVWAPKNEAIPEEIATLVDSLQGLAMQNHITPVDYPESAFKENLILKAFSGKSLWLHTDGNGYRINGNKVVGTVVVCKDGIIYDIEGFLDMKPTLYEGFWEDARYSRMREVLEEYIDSVFVKELSTEIGTDFEGRPVYDSVFVAKVTVFDRAKIDKDLSYYTVFLAPNDELEHEIETYYKNVKAVTGFDPDEKDSTTLNDWLVYSFIHNNLIEENEYAGVDNRYSYFSKLWRTSYQKIVPGSKREFSNGYMYELQDLFIPNSLIKTKEMNNNLSPVYELQPDAIIIETDESLVNKTTTLETPSGSSMKYLLSKVQLKTGATEDVPEFDYSVSWYTGAIEVDSMKQKVYKKVSVTPGEYKVSLTFIKNADANQDFAVYINDIYVNKVKMTEVTEVDKPVTLTLGRVEIPQSTGVAPVKVTMKNLVTSWKRALAPSGITLERTVNNY